MLLLAPRWWCTSQMRGTGDYRGFLNFGIFSWLCFTGSVLYAIRSGFHSTLFNRLLSLYSCVETHALGFIFTHSIKKKRYSIAGLSEERLIFDSRKMLGSQQCSSIAQVNNGWINAKLLKTKEQRSDYRKFVITSRFYRFFCRKNKIPGKFPVFPIFFRKNKIPGQFPVFPVEWPPWIFCWNLYDALVKPSQFS